MRLLITGGAGGVATAIRPHLRKAGVNPVLSDLKPIGNIAQNETSWLCDLTEQDAVAAMVADVDPEGIVHLGGQAKEAGFDTILQGNIIGTYNLFEAMRRHGKVRILFASSYHVIGFHEMGTTLDEASKMRPDSLYGLSKCYGELLARLYYDKFGIESVSVRIGSCFEAPKNDRMLSTWLSPADLARLIMAVFRAGPIKAEMIYGVSRNEQGWWSNDHANWLDWKPMDSADVYAANVPAKRPSRFQGGSFAEAGHPEDP